MRIALFSDTCSPQINGVTNTLKKLTDYLTNHHLEYKLFVPKYKVTGREAHTERFYSLSFFLYPECRIALPNMFRISQALSQFRPHIIHNMTEFNMGLAGLWFGKKMGIPTVSSYTTHFSHYAEYYHMDFLKQPIWDYMKWFHNQNHVTLCPSYEAMKELNSNGILRTGLFSRGIDTEKFNPGSRSDTLREELGLCGKTAFIYVGRLSQEKDLDVLNESYRLLQEKYHQSIALVLTGDGPYARKCKELFPPDTVFTGFKSGGELSQMYASGDIFVCPSPTETFGNVIQEAMASGLPVIGPNAGGINEIIEHRQNGLKFSSGDPHSLAAAMEELLCNLNLREQLKANGIQYARSRSWNEIFEKLLNTYDSIISKGSALSA